MSQQEVWMHAHARNRVGTVIRLATALAAALASPVGNALAQPILTRQGAIDEALARNRDLAALRAGLEVERLRPAQQQALAPPVVGAEVWQWPIDAPNPGRVSYMVRLEQAVPGRGKRTLRAKLAEADVKVSSARLAVRAVEIVAEVRRTYAALFLARESASLIAERLDLLRQMADASQIRYAAGRTSQQDVLKAVVEISRLHEEQIVSGERIRAEEARLNTLLARDARAPVPPLEPPREQAALKPLADLQRLAIEAQPRLQVARAEIERAEAAVAVADAGRRPDFMLEGGYMFMGGERDAITGGVGITWPHAPWSRRGLDLARTEARAEVAAARARYEADVSQIQLMVADAYIRAESAARRAALLRTSVVPQSGQALDVSRIGYQSDRAEFLDIIDNQRVLAEARLGYLRALAALDDARGDLEGAVGTADVLEQER
jgi:outer membrane protein TolC